MLLLPLHAGRLRLGPGGQCLLEVHLDADQHFFPQVRRILDVFAMYFVGGSGRTVKVPEPGRTISFCIKLCVAPYR